MERNDPQIPQINQLRVTDFSKSHRKMMLIYENGIKQIVTKFEIINNEYCAIGNRKPIETIKSRLKTPESIYAKMARREIPLTEKDMREQLHDIAGVRVVCSYVSDIYALRDMLLCQKDIRLIQEKDYIKFPKPNGYRSLHLIVECMLCMTEQEYPVKVEIQFRTIAMDFWASLEHELRYKSKCELPEDISHDLYECAEIISLTDQKMERIYYQIERLNSKYEEQE